MSKTSFLLICLLLTGGVSAAAYNESISSDFSADVFTPDSDFFGKTQDPVQEDMKKVEPGQLLYQNHCRVCHDSTVHIREKRQVRSIKDIAYWVQRWSTYLKLNWSNEQKQQVVKYLNQKYYQFPERSPSSHFVE